MPATYSLRVGHVMSPFSFFSIQFRSFLRRILRLRVYFLLVRIGRIASVDVCGGLHLTEAAGSASK